MKGWIWSYTRKRWEPFAPNGGPQTWLYNSSVPVKFTKSRRPTKPPMFSEG